MKRSYTFTTQFKVAAIVALLFVGVQVGLRLNNQVNLLAAVPVLLMATGAFVAYRHTEKADLRACDRRIKRMGKLIPRIEGRIKRNKEVKTGVLETLQCRAETLVQQDKEALRKQEEDFKLIAAEVNGYRERYLDKIDLYQEAGRNNYSDGYRDGTNALGKSSPSSNGKGPKDVFTAVLLAVGLAGALTSCGTATTPESTVLCVLIDKSEKTIEIDVAGVVDLYADLSGLEPGEVKNISATFIGASISDIALTDTITVSYPPPPSFLSRKEWAEKERVGEHILAVSERLTQYARPGPELQRSYVPQAICQQVELLQSLKADNRILVIYSDLLINTDQFSVYRWKRNPEGLKENKSLMEQYLRRQCDIDVRGIDVIVVHQPKRETSDLFMATQAIYREFLLAQGANSVRVIANI